MLDAKTKTVKGALKGGFQENKNEDQPQPNAVDPLGGGANNMGNFNPNFPLHMQ